MPGPPIPLHPGGNTTPNNSSPRTPGSSAKPPSRGQRPASQSPPRKMQWAFFIAVTLLTIIVIVVPVVCFYITQSPLYLAPVLSVIPLGYAWRRMTNYIFPKSLEELRIEETKIKEKTKIKSSPRKKNDGQKQPNKNQSP